ncbi:hypothetical protein ILYODFUR_031220 [Ilyodon furcidens]|uniref:Uncharacterized protein n=1 Tax=Ilyodon furcidens TaxID=33524 RepID=A0ABV0TNA2_9TELE
MSHVWRTGRQNGTIIWVMVRHLEQRPQKLLTAQTLFSIKTFIGFRTGPDHTFSTETSTLLSIYSQLTLASPHYKQLSVATKHGPQGQLGLCAPLTGFKNGQMSSMDGLARVKHNK